MKRVLAALLLILGLPVLALAQNIPNHKSGSVYNVSAYNTWNARVIGGPYAAGAAVIVYPAQVTLLDGYTFSPFNTTASVQIGTGANVETVTPTAVAIGVCPAGYGGPQGCATLTVATANTHGQGDIVSSGTYGLQEAINDASGAGGIAVIDALFLGTNTTITGATPVANVSIRDERGPVQQYYTIQPTTLTQLSAPATRNVAATCSTTTTVCSGTAVGTWPNSAEYVCVTYIDILGGESACSTTQNFTATASVALNFTSPIASTGAVGWRAYAGLTSLATSYQLPISSSTCVLTTLESVVPACAIGANGVFPTPSVTTNITPLAFVVNVYHPLIQAHTTFAYMPTNSLQIPGIQTNYGPFTATGSITGGDIGVLGTVNIPTGLLNYIGKSVRITGKVTFTAVTNATATISTALGPTYSTGTPTTACTFTNTVALTNTHVYNADFLCDITTNATGTSGTMMVDGHQITQDQLGTVTGVAIAEDNSVAALTNAQSTANMLWIIMTTGTAAVNPAQLLTLHLEALN